MPHHRSSTTLLPLSLALGLAAPLPAAAVVPALGTADADIRVEGNTARVTISAAARTLVGFTGAPADEAQRKDLSVAAENLRHGEALIRFNPQASCVIADAKVDADPKAHDGTAAMGAEYRFHCHFPQSLTSAALGLFIGFTALERVHVRYSTAQGQGGAVLTRTNPVVSFVPMQPVPTPPAAGQ